MNRRTSLFVAVLVAVALVGMVPLGAAVTDDLTGDRTADADEPADERNETGSDLAPGERLSGVVGVEQAELEGEVADRAFGLRLADAETDAERAAIIADQLDRNDRRLESVSERRNELHDRRAAGELSEGAYTARTARIGAEIESIKRTTNRSAEATDGIPDHVLQERNVSVDRVDALRDRASSLSGPEVAEMAREIGGNRTGAPMGPPHDGRPGAGISPPGTDTDEPGPPGNGPDSPGSPGGGAEPGNDGANGTHGEGGPGGSSVSPGESADDEEPHGGSSDESNASDADEQGADGDADEQGADGNDTDASDASSDGEDAGGPGANGVTLVSSPGASVDRR